MEFSRIASSYVCAKRFHTMASVYYPHHADCVFLAVFKTPFNCKPLSLFLCILSVSLYHVITEYALRLSGSQLSLYVKISLRAHG